MTKQLPEHTRQLARLTQRPGGVTADEAVAAAELRVEGLRDRGLLQIEATIREMHGLGTDIGADLDERRARDLYGLSNVLVGITGVFGKGGLGEVAISLCALIERLLLAGRWDQGAVRLHLDSLRLLSKEGVSQTEIATVSAALRQVVERIQPAGTLVRLN